MEMYNVHQDAVMLPIEVTSDDYTFGDKKLKAISASASRDKEGIIHLSLVNIDAHRAQNIQVELSGMMVTTVTGRILQADHLQDHNSFENPNEVVPTPFNGASISGSTISVKLPPFSVTVITLK